ncbi:MAG: hypothetical protein U0X92_09390 [Anaerolineales bacterium]
MPPTHAQPRRHPPHPTKLTLFDISPDNTKLAFAWKNKTGEWQIYEARPSPPQGEGSGMRVKSRSPRHRRKVQPALTSQRKQPAYALDSDGSESYHLIVYGF